MCTTASRVTLLHASVRKLTHVYASLGHVQYWSLVVTILAAIYTAQLHAIAPQKSPTTRWCSATIGAVPCTQNRSSNSIPKVFDFGAEIG